MFHDYVIRLLGVGIASLIYFLPINTQYSSQNRLVVPVTITQPVTKDARQLIRKGFIFRMRFYCSITLNSKKVRRFEKVRTVAYHDKQWLVDDTTVAEDRLQDRVGVFTAQFDSLTLREGDRVLLYCTASIEPDADFEKSTGLKTAILWNFYQPQSKSKWIYTSDSLRLQE